MSGTPLSEGSTTETDWDRPVSGGSFDSSGFLPTLQDFVNHICSSNLSLNHAEVLVNPHDAAHLVQSSVHFCRNQEAATFRKLSADILFPVRTGLPGRVWSTRAMAWHTDVQLLPPAIYLRTKLAQEAGLRGVVGVPIQAVAHTARGMQSKTIFLVVFYSSHNLCESSVKRFQEVLGSALDRFEEELELSPPAGVTLASNRALQSVVTEHIDTSTASWAKCRIVLQLNSNRLANSPLGLQRSGSCPSEPTKMTDSQTSSVTSFIRMLSFFKDLSEEDLQLISAHISLCYFESGEVVHKAEEEEDKSIWRIVVKGELAIFVQEPGQDADYPAWYFESGDTFARSYLNMYNPTAGCHGLSAQDLNARIQAITSCVCLKVCIPAKLQNRFTSDTRPLWFAEISRYFDKPILEAAKCLGTSENDLAATCQNHGIPSWPNAEASESAQSMSNLLMTHLKSLTDDLRNKVVSLSQASAGPNAKATATTKRKTNEESQLDNKADLMTKVSRVLSNPEMYGLMKAAVDADSVPTFADQGIAYSEEGYRKDFYQSAVQGCSLMLPICSALETFWTALSWPHTSSLSSQSSPSDLCGRAKGLVLLLITTLLLTSRLPGSQERASMQLRGFVFHNFVRLLSVIYAFRIMFEGATGEHGGEAVLHWLYVLVGVPGLSEKMGILTLLATLRVCPSTDEVSHPTAPNLMQLLQGVTSAAVDVILPELSAIFAVWLIHDLWRRHWMLELSESTESEDAVAAKPVTMTTDPKDFSLVFDPDMFDDYYTKEEWGKIRHLEQTEKGARDVISAMRRCYSTHLHHFRRVNRLGDGTLANVFEVADSGTGKSYAFKISIEGRGKKELASEIDILMELSHPNVVQAKMPVVLDGEYGLLMELCPQGTLSCLLLHHGALPQVTAAEFTQQILEGVAYIHRHGIAHRDLKPSNLLLTHYIIRIADFGCAIRRDTNSKERQRSRGTASYLAPEAVKKKIANRKIDIWAIGCCLYEMLTLQLPLDSDDEDCNSTYWIMERLSTLRYTPIIPVAIKGDTRAFLAKCFCVDPSLRPTAQQLLSHPFVSGRRLHICPDVICSIDYVQSRKAQSKIEVQDLVLNKNTSDLFTSINNFFRVQTWDAPFVDDEVESDFQATYLRLRFRCQPWGLRPGLVLPVALIAVMAVGHVESTPPLWIFGSTIMVKEVIELAFGGPRMKDGLTILFCVTGVLSVCLPLQEKASLVPFLAIEHGWTMYTLSLPTSQQLMTTLIQILVRLLVIFRSYSPESQGGDIRFSAFGHGFVTLVSFITAFYLVLSQSKEERQDYRKKIQRKGRLPIENPNKSNKQTETAHPTLQDSFQGLALIASSLFGPSDL